MQCGQCEVTQDTDGSLFSHFQHTVFSQNFHKPGSTAGVSAHGDTVVSPIPQEFSTCTFMYMIDTADDMCVGYCGNMFGLNENNTDGMSMGKCQDDTAYTEYVGKKKLNVFSSSVAHIPHVKAGEVAHSHSRR